MFFRKKKKEGTRAFRREMAKKLDGRAVKYVTERAEDGSESVIGRQGALIVKGDDMIVFSSADVVMRCPIDDMDAAELLSLQGVIISGPDTEHGGDFRSIIAYYTYYLK